MNKTVGMLSSFLLAAGILAGCGEADVKEVSNGDSKEKQTEQQKEKVYKVGETVSIDGMEITINKVAWGKVDPYLPAEKGKVVRVEASVKNNSQDNGFVDNTEFQLYAGDEKTEGYYGSDDTSNLAGGELKKGKSMKVVMEFDAPEVDSYELFYEPSFTFKDNAEVKWNLNKGEMQ